LVVVWWERKVEVEMAVPKFGDVEERSGVSAALERIRILLLSSGSGRARKLAV
jgi:hypothetical protein